MKIDINNAYSSLLKNAIHTGHYVIDPARVAEKLHQFTLELQ